MDEVSKNNFNFKDQTIFWGVTRSTEHWKATSELGGSLTSIMYDAVAATMLNDEKKTSIQWGSCFVVYLTDSENFSENIRNN